MNASIKPPPLRFLVSGSCGTFCCAASCAEEEKPNHQLLGAERSCCHLRFFPQISIAGPSLAECLMGEELPSRRVGACGHAHVVPGISAAHSALEGFEFHWSWSPYFRGTGNVS